jgi:ubiquinone/menaquinone biosynthesis C-methylase UbiE
MFKRPFKKNMSPEKMSQITTANFIPPHLLKTAVLFIVFNRPDTTKELFEAIRKAKPPRLYVAADGPRADKHGEAEKVEQVRRIATQVDWDCEVKTLFRDKNLGCKYAVSGSVDWFFENEEEGIILEDDCLPSQSFFWFCEELLERYREHDKIMQICGFNPLNRMDIKESYFFSKYGPIWGWASWARKWKGSYDVHMSNWPFIKKNNILNFSYLEKQWRYELFDKVYMGAINTWDYQWSFAKMLHKGYSIIPKKNLVRNIGFCLDSTHTKGKLNPQYANSYKLSITKHPEKIETLKNFEDKYLKDFAGVNLTMIIKQTAIKTFKKLRSYFSKKKWNVILDKKVTPLRYNEINYDKVRFLNVTTEDVTKWLEKGKLNKFVGKSLHKKGLEFFFSAHILNIESDDILLDAAGGMSNYLKAVKNNFSINDLYLTDHIFEGLQQLNDGIKIVGGDISSIHLENNSISKIACHHAFEHFQADKDIEFIKEAYRLLKDDGALVIIPLFLTDIYVECWNIETSEHFDENSIVIIDKTASVPGADDDGHFARFYDMDALRNRIIRPAETLGFECEIIECHIDGAIIPDMRTNFGSIINRPLRAIRFHKV